MLRILHIADAHLDTPFYGQEESFRRKLREATRDAFSVAVEEAIHRKVHAFLIAGDLFDNDLLSFTTERFLLEQMAHLREAGVAVFYATGNHDPGRANYRARHLNWPDNVHLFCGASPETVPIGDVGWLTAAGHSSRTEGNNLAAHYEAARSDRPHVAMLHTQIISARGAERHDRYAPCTRDDLLAPGYDYWALGHIHIRQQVFDDLPAWYSGNLQGRNPRETGPKGALYVEIKKGETVKPEFLPLAPVEWEWLEVRCPQEARTLNALTDALEREIKEHADLSSDSEYMVRVYITGESVMARDLAEEDNIREISDILMDRLGVAWLEIRPRHIVRPVDLDEYRGSATVLSQVLELIEQARTDNELLEALRPDDLAGRPADQIAYVRALLEGADREIAACLVPEDGR